MEPRYPLAVGGFAVAENRMHSGLPERRAIGTERSSVDTQSLLRCMKWLRRCEYLSMAVSKRRIDSTDQKFVSHE
eukprot:241285-Prymnesium_polylepis.1